MSRVFIIAEAGVNHNGDLALAHRLIDAAAAAGVDAVKFQAFTAESLVTDSAGKAAYQSRNLGDATRTQREMLQALELQAEDFSILRRHCQASHVLFLATPFDPVTADWLEPLVDRYKIASGDCTNLPLLDHIAGKGKPVILSTGMADLDEVRAAVDVLRVPLTLLHCTTNYPCPPEEVNLRALQTLRDTFNVPVGYSDHTEGIDIPVAAVALGATVIEKHFTLDRHLPGPDHRASLEPSELAAMVTAIRRVEAALGDGVKCPQPSERAVQVHARRSLVFARDLRAGQVLAAGDLVMKRPGSGLPPAQLSAVLGKRLRVAVQQDTLLSLDMLES